MRDLSKLLALELLQVNKSVNIEVFTSDDIFLEDKIVRVTVEMLDLCPTDHQFIHVAHV